LRLKELYLRILNYQSYDFLSNQAWQFIVIACSTALPASNDERDKNEAVFYENDDPGLFAFFERSADGW
jgi:hypothetical protein